jgi:Fe-S-cluster containining protein
MAVKAVVKPRAYPQVVKGQSFVQGPDGRHRLVPAPDIDVPAHHGFYVLQEDCGNLEPEQPDRVSRFCQSYDTRPEACRSYELGSQACLDARAAAGLDGHQPVPEEARLDREAMRRFFDSQ